MLYSHICLIYTYKSILIFHIKYRIVSVLYILMINITILLYKVNHETKYDNDYFYMTSS